MIIEMATEFGKQLQGELLGKKHFARIWEMLTDAAPGESVILNFKGVNVVTGSWISAMLVPFYRRASDPEIDLFPVLCNADQNWLDDLSLVAKWTRQCYVVADRCHPNPRIATLVGSLDPGQRTTLEAVIETPNVTGATLERDRPKDEISATAWNNRLKDLHEKRLLRRTKRGREQIYSPVVEVIKFNG